jgi:hypothetical protein
MIYVRGDFLFRGIAAKNMLGGGSTIGRQGEYILVQEAQNKTFRQD